MHRTPATAPTAATATATAVTNSMLKSNSSDNGGSQNTNNANNTNTNNSSTSNNNVSTEITSTISSSGRQTSSPAPSPNILNANPSSDNLLVVTLLAICYQSLGHFRTAIHYYSKALITDQNSFSWYQREVALYIWIRLDKNLKLFNIDDDIDPRIKDGWCQRTSWRKILPSSSPQSSLNSNFPVDKKYIPLTQPKNVSSFEDNISTSILSSNLNVNSSSGKSTNSDSSSKLNHNSDYNLHPNPTSNSTSNSTASSSSSSSSISLSTSGSSSSSNGNGCNIIKTKIDQSNMGHRHNHHHIHNHNHGTKGLNNAANNLELLESMMEMKMESLDINDNHSRSLLKSTVEESISNSDVTKQSNTHSTTAHTPTESPTHHLLRITEPYGSWIQTKCTGFLPNRRQVHYTALHCSVLYYTILYR